MKLVSCTIAAFGGTTDREYRFHDAITEIREDNGAGKSTLAGFLKVMLYGLDGTAKQSLLENDLKFYAPFAGGRFGGSLTFLKEGREYRLERYFERRGTTGVDETLRLVDTLSGKAVPLPEGPVGKLLFGVDADSFLRTVYLTPRFTPREGSTPVGITAKLNDLAGEVFDLDRFPGALEALDKRRTELKLRRGQGGRLADAEERRRALLDEIREAEAAENGAAAAEESAVAARREAEELDAFHTEAEAALREATRHAEEIRVRESRRAELTAALTREEGRLAVVCEHFEGAAPAEAALAELSTLWGRVCAVEDEAKRAEDALRSSLSEKEAERLNALAEERDKTKTLLYNSEAADEKTAGRVSFFTPVAILSLLLLLLGAVTTAFFLPLGLCLLLLGAGALTAACLSYTKRKAAAAKTAEEAKAATAEREALMQSLRKAEAELAEALRRAGLPEDGRPVREVVAEAVALCRLQAGQSAALRENAEALRRVLAEALSHFHRLPTDPAEAIVRLRALVTEAHTLEFSIREKREALAALPPAEKTADGALLSQLRVKSEALRARATEAHRRAAELTARAEELRRSLARDA